LGDSFTEARQVDIADTYWKLLEKKLNSCAAFKSRQVEVLNFGIGGYNTTQELITLRKDVISFSPDLVILAFTTGNDVYDNSQKLMKNMGGRSFGPYYLLRNEELVLDNSFRNFGIAYLWRRFQLDIIHYSRVFDLLNQFRRAMYIKSLQKAAKKERTGIDIGLSEQVYRPPENKEWDEAWTITEKLIQLMNQEVTQSGADFILVTLSNPIQVNPDTTKRNKVKEILGIDDFFYPERRLRELGNLTGFQVITLAVPLQVVATNQNIYLHGFENTVLGHGHWNQDGHRSAAKILAERLCTDTLLP
jgi:hypothetical protein